MVGEEDADTFGGKRLDQLLDLEDSLWINSSERFIEQEKLWIACQGTGNLGTPPLSSTEGISLLGTDLFNSELSKQLLNFFSSCSLWFRSLLVWATKRILSSTLSLRKIEGSWGR